MASPAARPWPFGNDLVNLLLVCTANICRSPMAEVVMRHAIARRGLNAGATSAGVRAQYDQPAHPHSVTAIAQAGLGNLSDHHSQPVSASVLADSGIVLCMDSFHRQEILARWPQYAGRVRLIGHWQGIEVADPVNGPLEEFEDCLRVLVRCTDQWLDRLVESGLLR